MSLTRLATSTIGLLLVACSYREVERPTRENEATPPPPESPQALPVEPESPDLPAGLATTDESLCVRFSGGTVRCLGSGADGDHGRGQTQCVTGVSQVDGLDDTIEVVGGESYYCARRLDGTVWCWGSHYRYRYDFEESPAGGEEGVNTLPIRLADVRTLNPIALTSAADGEDALCTIETSPPRVACIREREHEQPQTIPGDGVRSLHRLGERAVCALNGEATLRCKHVRNYTASTATFQGVVDADGRSGHGCIVYASGKVECGDTRERLSSLREIPGASDIVEVAAGETFACGRTRTGQVQCWGAGPVPGGYVDGLRRATPVEGLDQVVELAAGARFVCARRSDGDVRCWGALGDGRKAFSTRDDPNALSRVPVEVVDITDAEQVEASYTYTCAIRAGGAVACWGAVPSSQGRRILAAPQPVPDLRGSTELALAEHALCGRVGAEIRCVGDAEHFATTRERMATTPATPDRFRGVRFSSYGSYALTLPQLALTQIANGATFACGHDEAGVVSCWGSNVRGQLGRNLQRDHRTEAVAVFTAGRVRDIAAGAEHVCVAQRGGKVLCWGDDTYGQLGRDALRVTLAPASVHFDAPCEEAPLPPPPR